MYIGTTLAFQSSTIVWNFTSDRVVCENSAHSGLRSLAVVELEHAAEPRTARDRACADRRGLGRNELVAQTLVRPLLMIMLDTRSDGSPEVPVAEGHESLQALGLGRPNKPLGTRVHTGDSTQAEPVASRHCLAAGAERQQCGAGLGPG